MRTINLDLKIKKDSLVIQMILAYKSFHITMRAKITLRWQCSETQYGRPRECHNGMTKLGGRGNPG